MIIKRSNIDESLIQYLVVKEKIIVEKREKKKFPEHGNLIDTKNSGNGYHGRCENCHLALVTDLGYTSWKGTQCILEAYHKERIEYTYRWTKDIRKASRLDEDRGTEHRYSVQEQQGWGRFNFFELSDMETYYV